MEFGDSQRAQALAEALPYIQNYSKKTVVIQYGGEALTDPALRQGVIRDIILLKMVGIHVVVVHGGGPETETLLEEAGAGGSRDQKILDAVQMRLCGKLNKDLTAMVNRGGCGAVGLCGIDGGMLQAVQGQAGGLEGDITHVDPQVILDALQAGFLPVIAAVAQGMDADATYPVRTDEAAARIAVALGAEKLVLLTGMRGLLRNRADERTLISQIRLPEIPLLIREGAITGGMLSKVSCCVEAVRSGVKRAHILDGRTPHALLMELLTHAGIGTMIL